jgi:hypothetical protein
MTRIRRPPAEAGDPAQFLAAVREVFALDDLREDREPDTGGSEDDNPPGPAPGKRDPSGRR